MTPVQRLAREHLAHDDVYFAPELPEHLVALATRYLEVGLDHLSGEEVVAVIDESRFVQAAARRGSLGRDTTHHFDGVIVTDRRIVAGSPAEAIALLEVTGAEVSNQLLGTVTIRAATRKKKVSLALAEPLARFLDALSRVPPAERGASTGDALGTTDARPTEPRAARLLDVVEAAKRKEGMASELARISHGGLGSSTARPASDAACVRVDG